MRAFSPIPKWFCKVFTIKHSNGVSVSDILLCQGFIDFFFTFFLKKDYRAQQSVLALFLVVSLKSVTRQKENWPSVSVSCRKYKVKMKQSETIEGLVQRKFQEFFVAE